MSKPLDPTPYYYAFGGERISADDAYWTTRVVTFNPRPEYEQDRSKYTGGSK